MATLTYSSCTVPTGYWNTTTSYAPYAEPNGPVSQVIYEQQSKIISNWREGSVYVRKMIPMHVTGRRFNALLVTTSVALTICFALIVMGFVFNWGGLLYPLAFIFGFASYASLMRWVALQDHTIRLMWSLERFRQILGYEGDPGQYPY